MGAQQLALAVLAIQPADETRRTAAAAIARRTRVPPWIRIGRMASNNRAAARILMRSRVPSRQQLSRVLNY
eukprot:SAG31_NODE_3924_length_3748_cov_2.446150_5_plen_71_part_00